MISIITPTYNRAYLLPRMIKSVLNQTFKDWELIIVDDGSTDDTSQIIENFKDSRIKYFFKDNSGATASRNLGVNKAQGDYVIFLDSDDEAKANWLQKLSDEIIIKKTTVACCGLEKHDHRNKLVGMIFPKNLGGLFNYTVANFLSGTILMKKEYFLEAGEYDIELASGQHTEILIRLLPIFERENVIISNIFEPLVIIHIHKGDRIRHNYDAIYSGSILTLKKHQDLFLKNKDKHYDYLSVAAMCAFKTHRIPEGKQLVLKAFKLKPFSPLSITRLIIGFTPIIRKNYWKNDNKNQF